MTGDMYMDSKEQGGLQDGLEPRADPVAVAVVRHRPHRTRGGRDDVMVDILPLVDALPDGLLLYAELPALAEATDEMIDAACNAVPGLYRVDAMRAIEAAIAVLTPNAQVNAQARQETNDDES